MGSWKKIKAKKRRRTDDNDQETLGEERRNHAIHSESTLAFTKPCDSIMTDFFARAFPNEFGKGREEIELD